MLRFDKQDIYAANIYEDANCWYFCRLLIIMINFMLNFVEHEISLYCWYFNIYCQDKF